VEVALNVGGGLQDGPKGLDKIVDLARVGAPDSVSNTDTVDSELIDSLVQIQEIDQI
jgi:hypothetical protein